MWESILGVLSIAGRNNLRCLNHAWVRISAGSRHHSELRPRPDRYRASVPLSSLCRWRATP